VSSLATINGAACTRLVAQLPIWGRGFFDVDTAEDLALERGARVTIKVAEREFACAVLSGGAFQGKARYRAVMGAGGWGKEIAAKPYANDAGIKLSTVLRDAATACGETMGNMPATVMGPHYARELASAGETLNALAPRAWYVDAAGTTHVGAWPTVAYAGDGARTRVDHAAGVIELATDTLGELVPGVTVDGHGPASDVEYDVDAKRLTVRVYYARQLSRTLLAFSRMLEALDPRRKYRAVYEFRVTSQSGERFNLQPVRASSGMPTLSRVPTRGHPGIKATVAPAERVLIAFVDGDPSRPSIIAHDAPDAPGWLPSLIQLGEGTDPFVRKSDLDVVTLHSRTHVHPHALGPTSPATPTLADQEGSALVKGD
jgi:hypothetical protein